MRTERGRWRPYPKYKDSGLHWLGGIPAHWRVRRLKHIAATSFSSVDKHSIAGEQPVRLCNYMDVYHNETISEYLDFMQATASSEEVRRFRLRAGDVVITKDSESWQDIAVAAYVEREFADVLCGYHLALVGPKREVVDGRYLFRAFHSRGVNDQFRVAATGITRYGLSKYALDTGLFPMPPLSEQRTIIGFLDDQTKKIDTLMTKKKHLHELLQEGRDALISSSVMRGPDRSRRMKDSGRPSLGKIPKHWHVKRNKLLFRELDERSETGSEELLTVSHITGVTPRSEKEVYMFLAESTEGYKRVMAGDLVINTMWAWMGAAGVARQNGIVSPSYNVYRPSDALSPAYLDFLCRTPQYVCEMTRRSKGVWDSRLRLYPESFLELLTPVPPLAEQEQIVESLRGELAKVRTFSRLLLDSIERLKEYRTALISAAVTGKIDVREEVGPSG